MRPALPRLALFAICTLLPSISAIAQSKSDAAAKPLIIEPSGPAHAANTNGFYAQLRQLRPGGESIAVQDYTLERQGAKFFFKSGSFVFYPAVNGHVTGAVFTGNGTFTLNPPTASERKSLALLTKSPKMTQEFTMLVLRFTDDTAAEIHRAPGATVQPAATQSGPAQAAAEEVRRAYQTKLHSNLDARLLEDVLLSVEESKAYPGGLFTASFHMGGAFTGRNVLFTVDPEGAPGAEPEEVALATWTEDSYDVWAAYRAQRSQPRNQADGGDSAGLPIHVTAQSIDMTIEKSGRLHAHVVTSAKALHGAVHVLPLELYRTLRVSGVYAQDGSPLDFIQEDKEKDPDFAVVLSKPLAASENVTLRVDYAGTDVVEHDGEGVYYLNGGARESWYPAGREQLGGFADYRMRFHIPKDMEIIATGVRESSASEPDGTVQVWKTVAPIAVAGFNLGRFKSSEEKVPTGESKGFMVSAYANTELPDWIAPHVQSLNLGGMGTTGALKMELSQGDAAIQVYTQRFGKLPFDHVALTEQDACNYGQSWPMLVYLPICGFWDQTIQHTLGLLDHDASYWSVVTAHEVAHQWWGQMVGFSSYRDQWMSEGFANYSAALFLRATRAKPDEANQFWEQLRHELIDKNRNGVRPINAGALTMGNRVSNSKAGEDVYQHLIYAKGAFIPHMLESLYWSQDTGSKAFDDAMRDFAHQYSGKAATTEDWKAVLEAHMPPAADLAGNRRLDWFFDEFVYGTDLPHYTVNADFGPVENGASLMHYVIEQSNVSPEFVMAVPMYLQLANGSIIRMGSTVLQGNTKKENKIRLTGLPSPPKKLIVNYDHDVLSD